MQPTENTQYRAVSGAFQGFGATPNEALAALMQVLSGDPPTPITIWPFNRGNLFFTEEQQARLQELKSRQATLTPQEERELDALIDASFKATITRSQTVPRLKS